VEPTLHSLADEHCRTHALVERLTVLLAAAEAEGRDPASLAVIRERFSTAQAHGDILTRAIFLLYSTPEPRTASASASSCLMKNALPP